MATVITHFYNESFLLPFWLRHHTQLFEHGILIDYASTDDSADICRTLAPDWEYCQSRNGDFNAANCDAEVIDLERAVNGYKIALTTTEFLYCPDLDGLLSGIGNAARVKPVALVDTAPRSILSHSAPLSTQCHTGFFGGYMEPFKARTLHCYPDGAYEVGRHSTHHLDVAVYPEGALIGWYGFAPWVPQMRERKLQIQNRIPDDDKQRGHGVQHLINHAELDAKWRELIPLATDLRQNAEYASVVGV